MDIFALLMFHQCSQPYIRPAGHLTDTWDNKGWSEAFRRCLRAIGGSSSSLAPTKPHSIKPSICTGIGHISSDRSKNRTFCSQKQVTWWSSTYESSAPAIALTSTRHLKFAGPLISPREHIICPNTPAMTRTYLHHVRLQIPPPAALKPLQLIKLAASELTKRIQHLTYLGGALKPW